jgi:hypothetical protein
MVSVYNWGVKIRKNALPTATTMSPLGPQLYKTMFGFYSSLFLANRHSKFLQNPSMSGKIDP